MTRDTEIDDELKPLTGRKSASQYHHQPSSIESWSSREDHPPPPSPPPPAAPAPSLASRKISSLDFERVVNEYSIQATKDRYVLDHGEEEFYQRHTSSKPPPRKSNSRTVTRWALSAIVGLVTGLTTIVIVQITGVIVHWRTRTLDYMAQTDSISNGMVFMGFSILNLLLALGASGLCVFAAPEGTGSGIPEVKAYLNGVRVKKFTSWRLFGVKIFGTILSVSSSLAVGMEGPLIHIGAIVGASFSKIATVLSRLLSSSGMTPTAMPWTQSLWSFTTTNLVHFAVDAERRDLISIGSSVGFAASFGAPIGGLLFILDDISSYFSKSMFIRTLAANAIGTFCLALRSGNLSNYSVINLGTYQGVNSTDDIFLNRFEFVPLFILVGALGGALGGIFCKSFEFLKIHWMDRLESKSAKLAQVALLSIITSALTFGLPVMAWTCQDADSLTSNTDRGRQFFCEHGQVNEMATIMFGSRDDAIKRILSDPSQFQEKTLWTVAILFYGLMTLTYGSILPSGIFTPTVLIGASLGGAAGLAFENIFGPEITPSAFALLGVAAMLAGIQRSTVSICVILVEGTGQIKVLLPVIIVVLVARYVAEYFHPQGLYETSMAMKQYPYLDHEEKRRYDILEVREIMSHPPEVIGPVVKASQLVRILRSSSHNGYPVVEPKTKKFLGLVRRDQIVALLECGVFHDGNQLYGDGSSVGLSDRSTVLSSPRPGVAQSPLMHWAYHIKDDRYDYLKNARAIEANEDEFDKHEWLRNVRDTFRSVPDDFVAGIGQNRLQVPTGGDDSIPTIKHVLSNTNKPKNQHQSIFANEVATDASTHPMTSSTNLSTPMDFAEIGVNEDGNLIVSWLSPNCHNLYVNVSAVMNRGVFCVPSHLPVSKARFLFTQLGLRHVVVLGGETGGEVVGIFTRANFMPSYIRQRTGVTVYYSE